MLRVKSLHIVFIASGFAGLSYPMVILSMLAPVAPAVVKPS